MEYTKKRDFSLFYDTTTQHEADRIYQNYKIKIKKSGVYDSTIKIKIIDRFNYVIHVDFTLDNNEVIDYSCDGSSLNCKDKFCCHCCAALNYLRNKELFSVFLPDIHEENPTNNNEAITEASEINLSVNNSNTANDETICSEEQSHIEENVYEDDCAGLDDTNSASDSIIPKQMKILFGTNSETNEEVFFFPNDTDCVLNTNIGIIGTMGTGKTQFTKSLVTQLYRNQSDNFDGSPIGILIFDYKGDYNETKADFVKMTNARIIKPYNMPFNPLSLNLKQHNKALLPLHTANAFKDTISKIYNLGPKQENTLFDCIMAAYKEMNIDPANESTWKKPSPTFEMVYRQYEKSAAFNDNDKLAVVMNKLKLFSIFDDNPLRAVPLSKLLQGVLVVDISDYDEDIQNLVVAITLDQFYAQMQTFGSSKTDGKLRQLKTIILVDEADNFMKLESNSLRKIMKEGREFGVGTILSTQSLAHFNGSNDDYSKYIITWVIHNVNDLNRRSIEAVLNQAQKSAESEELFQSIKSLKKHQSVVKISNNDPIIMYDKPFWELVVTGSETPQNR